MLVLEPGECLAGPVTDAPPADLVRAAARGDASAWDALVERHTPLLWAVARSFRLDTADAADAVQTTWLRLLEHIDRITEPEHVAAWLATTTRRECLRQLRRAGREQPVELVSLDVIDLGTAPLDAGLLREERDAELWRAVEALPERCRALLRVLMADPPPAYDVVAAALDMPVGSIGPTRSRCLDRLRRVLAGDPSTARKDSSAREGRLR